MKKTKRGRVIDKKKKKKAQEVKVKDSAVNRG
jgi:hypothetical protein